MFCEWLKYGFPYSNKQTLLDEFFTDTNDYFYSDIRIVFLKTIYIYSLNDLITNKILEMRFIQNLGR